jgi:hypothetical protein
MDGRAKAVAIAGVERLAVVQPITQLKRPAHISRDARVELYELPLGAVGAVEQQPFFRPIIDPIRPPAFIVAGQPELAALLARRNQCDSGHGARV